MFKTLLLAVDVDDAEDAKRTTEAAIMLARAEGAVLHLLNVVSDSGMAIVSSMLGPDHPRQMAERAKTELKAWAAKAIPADLQTELHIAQGTVYDQIIKSANKLEVDLIIVGAQRPQFQDYLIGPNAARVVRHASQTVFVVR